MKLLKELGFLALATRMRTLAETLLDDGAELYAGLGVPFQPRWFAVYYLLLQHEQLSVTEIAQRSGLSHPAIIKIVVSMEEAGLIDAKKSDSDMRKRLISLSAEGKELAGQLQPIWKALETELKDLFGRLEVDILGVLSEVEAAFAEKPISKRVHERYRSNYGNAVEFMSLTSDLAPHFRRLNEDWLKEYFTVEAEDRRMLDHPEIIVFEGGEVFFACLRGEVLGTMALIAQKTGVMELAKMTVAREHRNRGVGQLMLEFAIKEAKRRGAKSLVLDTSSKLEAANHIYMKFGFQEDRIDARRMKYARPSRSFVLELK